MFHAPGSVRHSQLGFKHLKKLARSVERHSHATVSFAARHSERRVKDGAALRKLVVRRSTEIPLGQCGGFACIGVVADHTYDTFLLRSRGESRGRYFQVCLSGYYFGHPLPICGEIVFRLLHKCGEHHWREDWQRPGAARQKRWNACLQFHRIFPSGVGDDLRLAVVSYVHCRRLAQYVA